MSPTPIYDYLPLVEDAVKAALGGLSPAGNAHWGQNPEGTVQQLLTGALARLWVGQHQDNGGQPAPHINAAGWAGLVVVKCLSRSDADARAGLLLARDAMLALPSPAGYALTVRWDRPVPYLAQKGIHQRGEQYELTIRRV